MVILICKCCESILIVPERKYSLIVGDKKAVECFVCGKLTHEPMRRVD